MNKNYYEDDWHPVYVVPTPYTKVNCCLNDDTVVKLMHTVSGVFTNEDCEIVDVILWSFIKNKLGDRNGTNV